MKKSAVADVRSAFHPVEHYYFQSYFGRNPVVPLGLSDEELHENYYLNKELAPPPFLLLTEGLWGQPREIENAVARLVLEGIENRLPTFAVMDTKTWSLQTSRPSPSKQASERPVVSLPTFLFEINWATSGPGFDWRETYHVTFLPEYEVHIVTASQDSPDALGFCDLSIGYFEKSEDPVSDAVQVVRDWWLEKVAEYDAIEYESLCGLGAASAAQVAKITGEVWSEETEDVEFEFTLSGD
jgi:hypothetical protein